MTKACQFRKDMKPGGDSRETDACYISGLFTREDPSFLPHGHEHIICSSVASCQRKSDRTPRAPRGAHFLRSGPYGSTFGSWSALLSCRRK